MSTFALWLGSEYIKLSGRDPPSCYEKTQSRGPPFSKGFNMCRTCQEKKKKTESNRWAERPESRQNYLRTSRTKGTGIPKMEHFSGPGFARESDTFSSSERHDEAIHLSRAVTSLPGSLLTGTQT